MSQFFVYRLESRKDAALPGLRRHVRGKFSATTQALPDIHQEAHGEPGGAIALRPSATPNQMRTWRQDARDLYQRGDGRPPDPWCEGVFSGAKIIDWSPEQGRKWGEHCVSEFERLFPHAQIIEAQLHTREADWHVHVVAQPRGVDHMGKLRCSKNAMLRSAVEIETGQALPIGGKRDPTEHRNDCSAIQDAFHRTCGEEFGLQRGVKGSKSRNKKISDAERQAATMRELDELKRRREAELADIGNLKAAKAAVAKREGEIKAWLADLKKRLAAVKEREAELAKQAEDIKAERKKYIGIHNAEVAKFNAHVKAEWRKVRTQRTLFEAAIAGELDQEAAVDAAYAAGAGIPLPADVQTVVAKRRRAARIEREEAAKAKREPLAEINRAGRKHGERHNTDHRAGRGA